MVMFLVLARRNYRTYTKTNWLSPSFSEETVDQTPRAPGFFSHPNETEERTSSPTGYIPRPRTEITEDYKDTIKFSKVVWQVLEILQRHFRQLINVLN